MKRILALAICLLSFACAHAQTYSVTWSSAHIHVTVTDSAYHDSTLCHNISEVKYTITVDSSYAGDSLNVVDTNTHMLVLGSTFYNSSGASPWIFTTSHTVWTSTFEGLIPPSGGYAHFYDGVLKVTTTLDTLASMQYHDSLWVLPCLYGIVSGDVYIDNNSNCHFDAGDVGLLDYDVTIIDTVTSPPGTINCSTGHVNVGLGYFGYSSYVQKSWMTSYSVSLPTWFSFIFPTSPCFTGPYTSSTLPHAGFDFPLQCTSNLDLQCYALSPDRVRVNTPFYMHPYISNTGCDTVSGQVTLVKDSRVIYDAALTTYPADTVHGDTLIWNYNHISSIVSGGPYWNSFFSNLHLTPDTTVVVGDTLCFYIYTHTPSADVDPTNNDYSICLPVVYSYDPNIKTVSPAGIDTAGTLPDFTKTLTYTLNFQNTGTDAAYNVKIIDTLDSHLNPSTLKILGTSHNMQPKWLTPNVIEFDFNYIMLPDSTTDEPGSHGQVRFSIDLDHGLTPGTIIENTGYIYFDSNPAVVTNTTHNVTALPPLTTSVQHEPVAEKVSVYPNPATEEINIEHFSAGNISILGIDGSTIMNVTATGNKTTINISNLAPGVYILRTINNSGLTTTKFMKY